MSAPAADPTPRRCVLFVPGSRPERYAKALASGADQVAIDLEDAVGPADKDTARDAALAFLGMLANGSSGGECGIRINPRPRRRARATCRRWPKPRSTPPS